jgi:aryl-alcohol dehydrogenase-like predicted oxidoreductase
VPAVDLHLGGRRVSLFPIVLGTTWFRTYQDAVARAALDAAAESGINCLETARIAPDSEREIGRWLRDRPRQVAPVLISKGGHPDPSNPGESRVDPRCIRQDLERSLDALGVATIDIYLLHRDRPEVPASEIVDFMDELVMNGLIGSWGVSNWGCYRLAAALAHADANRRARPLLSSVQLGLFAPRLEPSQGLVSISGPRGEGARSWYRTQRFPVLCWSPLGSGYLAYARSTRPPSKLTALPPDTLRSRYRFASNAERLARAHALAVEMSLSLEQVALAYVLAQGFPALAAVSASSREHIRDDAAAGRVALVADVVRWLETGSRSPME